MAWSAPLKGAHVLTACPSADTKMPCEDALRLPSLLNVVSVNTALAVFCMEAFCANAPMVKMRSMKDKIVFFILNGFMMYKGELASSFVEQGFCIADGFG